MLVAVWDADWFCSSRASAAACPTCTVVAPAGQAPHSESLRSSIRFGRRGPENGRHQKANHLLQELGFALKDHQTWGVGGSQNLGYHIGGPHDKDYSNILGSIVEFPH